MLATTAAFLTDYDLYLLGEGKHYRLHEKLGAHVGERDGTAGTHFAVWAPNAGQVSIIGDFNGWLWKTWIQGTGQGIEDSANLAILEKRAHCADT